MGSATGPHDDDYLPRTSQKDYSPKARRGQLLNVWKSTLTYKRLPQEPLNLSILKLDGSCFGVQVGRKATIADLKEAVEEVFTGQFMADGEISWSHVWGHFCLSYQGQKLVDDKAHIRLFGIKDGVQVKDRSAAGGIVIFLFVGKATLESYCCLSPFEIRWLTP
nr:u11/u12 small nuclear ribonucleoprotein 25 kda protein [Quercus suber]